MTRIKRGAAFLLGLCMALSLYACGGGQEAAGDMGRRLLRAGSGRRRLREGRFPLVALPAVLCGERRYFVLRQCVCRLFCASKEGGPRHSPSSLRKL